MSKKKDHNRTVAENASKNRTRVFSSDGQRRMTSITRKLHWYGIRRKIARFFSTDILILILLFAAWCADREYSVTKQLHWATQRSFFSFKKPAFPGFDLLFRITSQDGRVLLTESCLLPLAVMVSVIFILLILQFLSLLFSYYREDRAIRRILAPLNEIALRADELSRLSFTEDKYQVIEDALLHIQPDQAGAEGPLSFGDSDLSGVEAAMNNLLLRMRDTLRQQSQFVNDASHELRTPIAVIQGYANMLDRWGKTDEKILEESIAAIRHEADHMNYLVEQLLFLARGDSGKMAVRTEPVRTDAFMREIYEESLMIDEQHVYRLTDGGEACTVTIDPGLMKQAVRILIDNAVKYTPEGEEILLSYGTDGEACPYLQVQDTGSGIGESELPHIFERFFRADEARESPGTGLGLSIAKWIVDKHGGHFEILSRKDLGTRIRIVLPPNSPEVSSEGGAQAS